MCEAAKPKYEAARTKYEAAVKKLAKSRLAKPEYEAAKRKYAAIFKTLEHACPSAVATCLLPLGFLTGHPRSLPGGLTHHRPTNG